MSEYINNFEPVLRIILFLPIKYLMDLCLISRMFDKIISGDKYFWREKYCQDYGTEIINHKSYKELEVHIKIMEIFEYMVIVKIEN
jgi:hypothetical protein